MFFKTRKSPDSTFFCFIAKSNRVILEKYIWPSTKVIEDPSANARAVMLVSGLLAPLLFSRDCLLYQADSCNLAWHVQTPGSQPKEKSIWLSYKTLARVGLKMPVSG